MNDTVARYEKMVQMFPENELGRFSLGKALFDAGEFVRAQEHLAVAGQETGLDGRANFDRQV